MEVFAERGSGLQAVVSERSARQHVPARTDFAHVLSGIIQQLAANDDPADVHRAQCALGAPAARRAERVLICWPDRT
jgi:hypothetical protein